MPATLALKRGTGTNIQNESDALYNGFVQFCILDSAQVNASNFPIGVSDSTAYSYETHLYLKVTKAPDNQVDNVRFWAPASHPDNYVHMYVGSTSSSVTPVMILSAMATSSATTYTDPDNSLVWSTAVMTSIGDISHVLVMQMHIGTGAPVGDMANEDMVEHFSYDES